MKDVAEHAGVSFKTVSRVVNNELGVSAEVSDRVQEAIEALAYQPDYRARTLRSRGTEPTTIGFIHADLANPFFTAIHQGLESVALTNDCLILTGSSNESPERHEALVRAFSGRRVDGLVDVPVDSPKNPEPSAALKDEIQRGTPVVFIDREPDLPGDVVMSDHFGGARLGTQHLLNHGHRDIAFLGDQQYLHSASERLRGFTSAMADAGVQARRILSDINSEHAAEVEVTKLVTSPSPPTALFTAQNYLTIGAVRALHRCGLQHSTALVGFDAIEMADVIEPGVTLVPQDATELGRTAGELLFARLADPSIPLARRVLSVKLVERGSGEILGPFH